LLIKEQLIIINCGDCRAVLGSSLTNCDNKLIKDKNNKNNLIVATKLSRDHNARIGIEQQNLRWNHPGEDNEILYRCKNSHACYVRGRLQLTRSLGVYLSIYL
jgi:serine/threonine protein phosphatase PrpC